MTTITAAWGKAGSLRGLPRPVRSLLTVLALLAVWELLAVTVFAGRYVVPGPFSVIQTAVKDHFYAGDLAVTLNISWQGWVIGNGAALLLAALCLVLPAAEGGLLTLGVATYCVPTIAVGPLLVVLYGASGAKVAMSALSVFFVTLVAAVTGLRAASPTTLETVHAFGGGRWAQLVKVRLRASIPSLAGGLTISAPAAILGAMIGDYLGGEKGLGVVMLQAQQQLAVSRTWAVALVSTVVCGLAFSGTAVVARRLGADIEAPMDAGLIRRSTERGRISAAALTTARVLLTVAIGLGVWVLLVRSSGLSSFFVKSPGDVWHYLFSSPTAGPDRQVIVNALAQTLKDAGIGWVAGSLAALAAAAALVLFPAVSAAIMPFVIVLRSVPLIAMCPLLGLVFGQGLLGVTIIAGVVTFVPSLVTILGGLRAVPTAATDVVHCFGGAHASMLLKVRVPFSAPSLFAAAKISMPGAILGSVLAEWLITSNGLGHAMAYDVITSNYSQLWAAITVILVVSLGLYLIVGTLENTVRRRVNA